MEGGPFEAIESRDVGDLGSVELPDRTDEHVRGQLLFGAGVGLVTFVIRSWGAYPEGVAFAILMMNALHPFIDHLQFRQARHA